MSTSLASFQIKSVEEFENYLEYESEIFESRFSNFKEQVLDSEVKMHYQQLEGYKTGCENCNEEFNSESDTESEEEEEEEDEEVKQVLKTQISRNAELEQDIADLTATIDLYVKEAQNRDKLEEEWQETITAELKQKIRSLKDEIFIKIEEIHNLENTVVELNEVVNIKDAELRNKDKEILQLRKELDEFRRNIQMQDIQDDYKVEASDRLIDKEE